MSLRLLSAVLLTVALLFSPVARIGNGSMAMAAEMSAANTAANGHCSGMEPHSGGGKSDIGIDCISACAAAYAMLPTVAGPAAAERRQHGRDTIPTALNGILTEFETPPPRA